MRRAAALSIALGLLVSACGGTQRTITGTFVVTNSRFFETTATDGCHGTFDGIVFDAETRVWAAGNQGAPLAETTLGPGHEADGQCRFDFVLDAVPQDWGYSIHLEAGGLTFFPTYRDDVLEQNGWLVEIHVGPCERDPGDYCVIGGTPHEHSDPLPSFNYDL